LAMLCPGEASIISAAVLSNIPTRQTMAIESSCPSCNQLLRVPDESPGKNAKCPKCGMVVQIPAAGTPPKPNLFADTTAGPPVNPYASPQGTAFPLAPAATVGAPVTRHVVGVGPIFNYAWQLWQANLGLLVGAVLIMIAIMLPLSFGIGAVS